MSLRTWEIEKGKGIDNERNELVMVVA